MKRSPLIGAVALLVGAPLVGGFWAGLPEGFLNFPPLLHAARAAPPFDAVIFSVYAALAALTALALLFPYRVGFRRSVATPSDIARARYPAWGWLGLVVLALSWTAAWTRPAWLGALRHYTFTPLWLGFILVVDGAVHHRTGRSRVHRNPGGFALLFPVSSALWWYFEYLNRFVRNWWYEGAEVFTPGRYVLFATLCFSTVLPALVVSTDFLLTFPALRLRFADGPRMRPWTRPILMLTVFTGVLGLVALTRWPGATFALTWIAPLLVVAPTLHLAGAPSPFSSLAKGDWSPLVVPALAALVCGFFWELWNFAALPKWHYAVPYVQIAHVFEMPAVGFLGYLPFGPLCWCLWALLAGLFGRRVVPPAPDTIERVS